MYFIAIALTCIAFAAYVLFAVVYRSAKPAPKPSPVSKQPAKRKPTQGKKPQQAAVQTSKTVPKPKNPTKSVDTSSITSSAPKSTTSKKEEKKPAPKITSKTVSKQAKAPKPKKAEPLPEKTPSAENLSDFEKLEAGEEDNIFEEGWEIIKRRKPKKESSEDKDDAGSETEQSTDKKSDASPREKIRAKKEQRSDRGTDGSRNRDRPAPLDSNRAEGDRKNRKGDKPNRFPPRAETSQPEKKKASQPARDVRVGNYIFSRGLPNARPGTPGHESTLENLSIFVDEHGTFSDDTAPLKTAHLEIRFYKEAPKPQRAKPGNVWEEMAKYNYTNKPAHTEEDKEEGEGEEESGTSEMPFAKEEELVDCFLRSLGANYTKHLNKAHMEKGKPQRFLSQTDLETTKQDLLKLLMQGVSEEPPVCSNKEEASEFVDKVFGQFEQSALRCFSHMGPRLWTRGFRDEGFFLFDNNKIALFWFLGYD